MPIYLPIKNVTLADGVQKRGIALSVGTPEQTLVFQATLDIWFFLQEERLKLTLRRLMDDTYLYDNSSGCSVPEPDPSTPLACSATVGGIWDQEQSSSWHELSSDDVGDLAGTETIRIGSNLSLLNVPIQISSALASAQNFLGLTKTSTFLNRLSSAGLIASRAFGFYQGWTGSETQHQVDGSLVFGGYDEAQTIGENMTFSFGTAGSCQSGFSFTISDIKMNFLNGTDVSIFDSSPGATMNACLSFSYPLMVLPAEMWNSFVRFSGVNVLGRAVGIHNDAILISGHESSVFFC